MWVKKDAAEATRSIEIVNVRIELDDSEPVIWRSVEVSVDITLKQLHEVIQRLMGWQDYHLWEFSTRHDRYGVPMEDDWDDRPLLDARKVRVRDISSGKKTSLSYVYDFGDDWRMSVEISKVQAGDSSLAYPRYVGGECAAPPEDCGGIYGFYHMLEVHGDRSHPDHAEIKEFLNGQDPAAFDETAVKRNIEQLAKRRYATGKRNTTKALKQG